MDGEFVSMNIIMIIYEANVQIIERKCKNDSIDYRSFSIVLHFQLTINRFVRIVTSAIKLSVDHQLTRFIDAYIKMKRYCIYSDNIKEVNF